MENIGIITSAKELNYGAILQAYALQKYISNKGYNAELLWWKNQKSSHHDIRLKKFIIMGIRTLMHPKRTKKVLGTYKQAFNKSFSSSSIEKFEKFETESLNIKYCSYREMKHYAKDSKCKAVISGSDQIWNSYAMYVDPFYYLRFSPKAKRIAYAPSIGKDDIPDFNKKIMKKYMKDFNYISIREKSGAKLVEQLLGKKVENVCDPVFLLEQSDWIKKEKKVDVPKNYILLYCLDEPSNEMVNILIKFISEINLPVYSIPYKFNAFKGKCNINYIDAGPGEFLYLVHNATYIITDSFHGTAFSLLFKKKFLTFSRNYGINERQSTRITDLLLEFNEKKRYITEQSDIKQIILNDMNYDIQMEKYIKKSKRYLEEALLDIVK